MASTPMSNLWVTRPKPNPGARLRLFCFPYAGGSASAFRRWWDDLPPAIEVCPLLFPGREGRLTEEPYTEWPPLLQALADAILPWTDLPFAFFGHSLGTLVSFEVARILVREHHMCPAHLFVGGRRGPQVPHDRRAIHLLPEPEFVKELRDLNGTPEEVLKNDELMQLFMPILRADFALADTYCYEPGPPLPCPISVYGGLADPNTNRENLGSWREQTTRSCTVRMLPGDHFFLHSHRDDLLRSLASELWGIVTHLSGGANRGRV